MKKTAGNVTSQRIRSRRTQLGLLQKDLAEKLNELAARDGLDPKYSAVSVSKWESRGSIPQIKTMRYLAEIFDVSVAYLSGETDELRSRSSAMAGLEDYKELTLDALDAYFDGLPVWLEVNAKDKTGMYGLYDASRHMVVFKDGTAQSVKKLGGKIYGGPSPFSVSMRGMDEQPLDLDEIKDKSRVWVEPIHTTEEIKAGMRGWYVCDKKAQAFIGPNGMPLPFAMYGTGYVAFSRAL